MVYLILIASICGILACVSFLLITAYRHYGSRGKTVRIRFIQDRNRDPATGHCAHGQGKALLDGTPTSILLHGTNLNLLLIYSHDSPEHDAAVLAFADFLRDVFNFDVHVSLVWSLLINFF
jgi:hypothetical protein